MLFIGALSHKFGWMCCNTLVGCGVKCWVCLSVLGLIMLECRMCLSGWMCKAKFLYYAVMCFRTYQILTPDFRLVLIPQEVWCLIPKIQWFGVSIRYGRFLIFEWMIFVISLLISFFIQHFSPLSLNLIIIYTKIYFIYIFIFLPF